MTIGTIGEVSFIIMKIQIEKFMHIFQKETANIGTLRVEATSINLISKK